MNKRNSIRIELTTEQQQQVKEFSGRDISALELEAQELEQRIAPAEFTITHYVDKSSPNLMS